MAAVSANPKAAKAKTKAAVVSLPPLLLYAIQVLQKVCFRINIIILNLINNSSRVLYSKN